MDQSPEYYTPPPGAGLLERLVHRVETAALAVSMLAVMLTSAIIGLSVFSRFFLGRSIPDSVVMVENLMPVIVALPLAYVAARRGHIEVEVFTNWLPPRGLAAVNLLADLVGLIIFGLIAWGAWSLLERDFISGRFHEGVLRLPSWPAKAMFFLGMVLFCLRLFLSFIGDLRQLILGRNATGRD